MKLSMYQIERLEYLRELFGELECQRVALRAILDDPQYQQPNLTKEQSVTWRRAQAASREHYVKQKKIREDMADCVLQLENVR